MNLTLHEIENGKFFNAKQEKYIYHFKNIKEGLYKKMHQYGITKYVYNSN
jgi:hypothetical protein